MDEDSTCAIFAHVGNYGKQRYRTKYYNLDVILSVGYRVNSINATAFRRWATRILKDYLLRGYAFSQRIQAVETIAIDAKERVEVLYHIGASLKDLGKKWFAFSKMGFDANTLLQHII